MPRPVPPGLWRRVPPAAFPPILGALGLALAWLAGVGAFALPPGLAQFMTGMAVALFAFVALAYGVKLVRRPGVLVEELSILPGRSGTSCAVLSIYLTAALLGEYAPGAGRVLLVAGLALHIAFLVVLTQVFRRGPPEQRRISPAWHLAFTGIIVAARAGVALDWTALATALFWPAVIMALVIYAVSLRDALRGLPPAPLRPMLAIHLAPVALFGTVAMGLGWTGTAQVLGWLSLIGVGALLVSGRWLLAAGFSPMWGAMTFPAAATAGLWVGLWRVMGSEGVRLIAGMTLVGATLLIVPVLALILRDWARGRLPVKTNAAIA